MWPWQEGAREAVSTFHTAANLLDEFPAFIFNHNESLVYEWVEQNDPRLFARIRRLVKAGRWQIAGGWYLQPDCNLPGGETIIRLILEGRRYFKQKFGAAPNVAYNFDSFGHPASFPQIFKQAGFDLYIHCRPPAHLLNLPAPLYMWQGHDGTRVMATRPDTGWYCTGPEDVPGVQSPAQQARNGIAAARASGLDQLVMWGLGDHGGGPTREDLKALAEAIAASTDVEVRHSTHEAYYARISRQVKPATLPVHADELQRAFAGCYSSISAVKQSTRRSEAMLDAAERWAALAWWRTGQAYPAEELRKARKSALFNTFHDTLAGSYIETAHAGIMDGFGYACHIAAAEAFKAQNALLPATPPALGSIPMYVFNPHPTPMKAALGTHFMMDYRPPPTLPVFGLFDDQGQPVACQVGSGTYQQSSGSWQPHVQFVADVPPLAVRRYEIRANTAAMRSPAQLDIEESDAGIVVQNAWLRGTFSREQAALTSLVDRNTGRELLSGALRLAAMRDTGDAWGGEENVEFNTPVADFVALTPEQVGACWAGEDAAAGEALRVLPSIKHPALNGARGSVACTVEGLTGWRNSMASIQVTLYAELPHIDIKVRLHMGERRKMMKLVLPLALPQPHVRCEVPYGVATRTADGSEHACNRWVTLASDEAAAGVANNGQYGFAVTPDGTLGLSLARGAVHTRWGHQQIEPNEQHTFMDQGQIETAFRLIAGAAEDVRSAIVPLALELNQRLDVFAVFYPPMPRQSAEDAARPFLTVSPATVQVGALKKADGESALIVRLVESIGQAASATLTLDGMARPKRIAFRAHEIKTFKITRRGKSVSIEPCALRE
jgi:alpha-mannosidase